MMDKQQILHQIRDVFAVQLHLHGVAASDVAQATSVAMQHCKEADGLLLREPRRGE